MEKFLNKKIGTKQEFRMIDLLFISAILAVALHTRHALFPIRTGDYNYFLLPWMNQIRSYGGFAALKYNFSNYNVPYMFLMCCLSYLPFKTLTALKLLSISFDFLAAFLIMKIVYDETKNLQKASLALAVTLSAPTILLNGAAWAQCDMIYCFFLLMSIYYLNKDKSFVAMCFFGVAFGFKLQALFFTPVLVILMIKNRVKLWHFIMVPVIYVIGMIPALIAGRGFCDILSVYLGQTQERAELTVSYPNFYALMSSHHGEPVAKMGFGFAILVLGCIAYYAFDKKKEINMNYIIQLSMLVIGTVIFTMPHMHERYGFMLDVLAIVYGFLNPKRIAISIALTLVSIGAYAGYVFKVVPLHHPYLALTLLVCMGFIAKELFSEEI